MGRVKSTMLHYFKLLLLGGHLAAVSCIVSSGCLQYSELTLIPVRDYTRWWIVKLSLVFCSFEVMNH